MKEEGRGGESELGSDLDLDPDPWKIICIRIRLEQMQQYCTVRNKKVFLNVILKRAIKIKIITNTILSKIKQAFCVQFCNDLFPHF